MKTQMDGWLEANALLRALFPPSDALFVRGSLYSTAEEMLVKVDRKMIAATYSQST